MREHEALAESPDGLVFNANGCSSCNCASVSLVLDNLHVGKNQSIFEMRKGLKITTLKKHWNQDEQGAGIRAGDEAWVCSFETAAFA